MKGCKVIVFLDALAKFSLIVSFGVLIIGLITVAIALFIDRFF
jgi:hypothetical protein